MSGTPELHPLFLRLGDHLGTSRRRAPTTTFQRESTRLRSNVADQVQRDLLPAGRLLSVFLVLCELLAEVAVLAATWGEECDRPLRFWVLVLMVLQTATVALHCLNIYGGHERDAFSSHRAGLSASDPDMYDDGSIPRTGAGVFTRFPFSMGTTTTTSTTTTNTTTATAAGASTARTVRIELNTSSSTPSPLTFSHTYSHVNIHPNQGNVMNESTRSFDDGWPGVRYDDDGRRPDYVDQYVRIVNALYLCWYIFGSVWVSGGGTCHKTAPHLYRLVVALTIIYYALLFLPLACFCLIVCCLPLFILVYRIMLPYAERERRRARAADPALVRSLNTVTYDPSTFPTLSGTDNVEDASCVICLCDYEPGEEILFLPCKHHFHVQCISRWLSVDKACCLCKKDIDTMTSTDSSAV